jgi:hypothetical protein
MATNPYAATPLYIAQADPATGRHIRAFYFLGEVPKAVLAAARRARPGRSDPRRPEWAAADGATLRGFYGGHWREILTPEDPPAAFEGRFRCGLVAPMDANAAADCSKQQELMFFTGGADENLDFGNLDDIDAIGVGEAGQSPAAAPGAAQGLEAGPAARQGLNDLGHAAGVPVYTDLAVYAEDTVYDLRLKLCVAAGTPLYRQHLFYYVNEEGPVVPYRFTLDGAPVLADWRALAPVTGATAATDATVIAGIVVDPRYEERREGIRIEALDTFTLLSPVPGVRITRAYYVDLETVLPPLGTAERPNDGLAAALRDRYQFDLLYYGGLLRYWPQLSPDACSIALAEPARLAAAYPALDPDRGALQARFEAERAVANRALAWRPTAAKGGRQMTAVTAATVRVAPDAARMRVAVRNVFDWIPTGLAVAAARARFDVDADLLAAAGAVEAPEARRGGPVPVIATKRHASSFGPRAAPAIDWFVGRQPSGSASRRDSVTYAVARLGPSDEEFSGAGPGQLIPYAYLTVHSDGRTETTADWREDDRVGFEAVTAEIAAIVGPTVAAINAMGAAAFPIGGSLTPPGRLAAPASLTNQSVAGASALTSLGAITVSAFWPHALTAAAFREAKSRFRAYEKAGIIGVRGLQQAGAYTFYFRKGVVAYDPRLADRAAERPGPEAEARTRGAPATWLGPKAQNQYTWLTDGSAAARWAAAFQGRTVRFHHRVTDLRVEIVGADSLAEFEVIRRYVFSFLDGLLTGPDRLRTGTAAAPAAAPAATPAASHRLRRLQERDPNLFDLKKYDQSATVYSVLCQSGRQPRVYSEAELAALGAKRRAALVRYWNFTEDAPAFYECPDPKYPHLSFRAGQHPLGYCLPCCKKARAAAGSRAALVNEECLARRAHAEAPEDKDSAAMSRHVLSYGKAVPAGRISDLPREVAEGLFLDALPPPYRLQLVGVEQSAPSVPEAGYAYALAFAVGLGDDTVDEVLSELAGLAAGMGDTYYALGGGAGAAFASGRDLAETILSAFVRRDPGLSPLGPGGAAASAWPDVLADLARHAYGVEVVVLDDPDGTGAVTVKAAPDAAAAISLAARGTAEGPGLAARPRIVLLAAGPSGTYPVAALNPKFYLRVAPAHRWMAARRSFSEAPPDAAAGDSDGEAKFAIDHVAEIVRGVLEAGLRGAVGPRLGATALDLGLIMRWVSSEPAFTVETRLVNFHNMCYGVLLRPSARGSDAMTRSSSWMLRGMAYVPVRLSAYPVDGTPATFGPRPAAALPAATLAAAVDSLNRYIAAAGEPYAPVVRAATIVDASGRAIGFTAGGEPLHFYHDAEQQPPAASGAGLGATAIIRFPYDSREVDLAIAASLTGDAPPEDAGPSRHAAEADVRNRLYRLFLAEFSAVLRRERNEALRGQLVAALEGTQYASAASVAQLRARLVELLGDYPDDLLTVRDAVARAYATAPRDPGRAALAAVAATSFSFDRQTMARLRSLGPHDAVVGALRALMAPHVLASEPHAEGARASGKLANMYVSCAEESAVHDAAPGLCHGRRLVVPAERLGDFYDILAADVRNPGKTGLLAAVSAGVLDALDFIRRPGEHLDIALEGR